MLANQITNYVQAGLSQLLQQYQGKPQIAAFFTIFLAHMQKIENALYPLNAGRQIYNGNAVGAQLDGIGQIVGVVRGGLTDAEYLVVILGTIAQNFSDTTGTTMGNIVQTVFQASQVFVKTPNSTLGASVPAQVSYGVGSPLFPVSLYPIIEQIILGAVGAGISVSYLSSFSATGCFACAGPQAWTKQAAPTFTPSAINPWPFGCGDLNNAYVGGGVASLVYTNPLN